MRATSVTILKSAEFEDRAVCHVTGHKNPKSLDSYCRPTEGEKCALAQVLDGQNATPAKSPNCAVIVQGWQSSTSSETREESNVRMQAGATSFSFPNTVFNGVTFNFGNSQALQQKRKSPCLKLKKKGS